MLAGRRHPDGTRLAELLAVLSLASDLGLGAPLERGLRTTIAALRTFAAQPGLMPEPQG